MLGIAWSANPAKLTSQKFPSWTHRFCMMNPCQIHEKSGSRVWGRGHCSHPRSPRGFGWLETIFLGKPGVKLTWNYIWVGLDRIVNYVNCIFDDFAILSFLRGAVWPPIQVRLLEPACASRTLPTIDSWRVERSERVGSFDERLQHANRAVAI